MFEFDFRRTPVTLTIAAVAIALEVVATVDPSRRTALYNDYHLGIWWQIWTGELWRPFTSTLLHGDLIHVLFNVYWLLLFGTVLEKHLGIARYAGVVFLAAYLPMLAQFIVADYRELHGCVGLSGVVYALFAVVWVARRYHTEYHLLVSDATVQAFLVWLVLCVVITYRGWLPIGNVAHASGLGLGWLMGKALFDPKHRVTWAVATTAVSITVLSTLIACPGHKGYEGARRYRQLESLEHEFSHTPAFSPVHPPVCAATNSRTAAAIGRVDNTVSASTARTRGQSSDSTSVTVRWASAKNKA